MWDVIIVAASTAILTTFFFQVFLLRRQMKIAIEEIEKKLEEELVEGV